MIPYNPSSFNSNKTILEQILELKNWLKDHPQYKIYCSSENGATLQHTYTLSNVYDNTDMDAGDVVLFANGTIASVISIDTDNNEFNTTTIVDIKGPQGPTGLSGYSLRVCSENYVDDSTAYSRLNLEPSHGVRTGDTILFANGYVGIMTTLSGTSFYVGASTISTQGPQGVSITNAQIDASGHLIVTLSDGNTIDAGSVVSGTGAYVIQLTSYTGTISADDLAIVNDPTKVCIIDYYENSKHSFYFKDKQITGGWRFSNLDYVEGSQITIMWYFEIDSTTGAYLQDYSEVFVRAENINSYGATSGQVLTADGSGGASWQTPSGGLVELEIAYADIGQALSDSDYAICLNADKMIVNYGAGQLIEYTRDVESSTDIKFARTYGSGIDVILVTKATKVVTNPTYKFVAGSVDSQTATNGQVLTADGNGGASWQNAGGGNQLYHHFLRMQKTSTFNVVIDIITQDSTPYANASAGISALLTYCESATSSGASYFYNNLMGYCGTTSSFTNSIMFAFYNKVNHTYRMMTYAGSEYPIESSTTLNDYYDTVVAL